MPHSFNLRKIVRKSSHWHRHGKHCSVLMEVRALYGRRRRRVPTEWYPTIQEALIAAAKESGRRRP